MLAVLRHELVLLWHSHALTLCRWRGREHPLLRKVGSMRLCLSLCLWVVLLWLLGRLLRLLLVGVWVGKCRGSHGSCGRERVRQ